MRMGASGVRIGFAAAVILAAVFLLQTQAVFEALLMFGIAGVVPGTNLQLSPDATMWTLGGFLVLSIALIFHKEIIVACMPAAPVPVPVVAALPQIVEAKPAAVQAEAVRAVRPARIWPLMARQTASLRLFIKRCWFALRRAEVHAQASAGTILVFAAKQLRRAMPFLRKVARSSTARLRRFDAWVIKQISKHDVLAETQKLLRECTKIAAAWLAKLRSYSRKSLQK